MMSMDEFVHTLDELVQSMPEELFRHLNGGVGVSEHTQTSAEGQEEADAPHYILAQYCHDRTLGRWITLYYGSIEALYAGAADAFVIGEMEKSLRQELKHHLEHMAGEFTIEDADLQQARAYLGQLH